MVAAEMPQTSKRRLKAQAVAARTYAVARLLGLYTPRTATIRIRRFAPIPLIAKDIRQRANDGNTLGKRAANR